MTYQPDSLRTDVSYIKFYHYIHLQALLFHTHCNAKRKLQEKHQTQGCYVFGTINHRRRERLTLQDVGDGAKEPVKPVEDGTILALGLATEQSDKRLCKQTIMPSMLSYT